MSDGDPIEDVAPGQSVVTTAFELTQPNQVAATPVRLTNGYAVIQLAENKRVTREDFAKERGPFIARMVELKQQDLLVAYVANLRSLAGSSIKLDEKWVQEPERRRGDSDDSDE